MNKQAKQAPLAIVLSSYTSGHFGHFDGYIALAQFDGEHPGSARYDAPEAARLRISSQCDDSGNRLYGWQVRYDVEANGKIGLYEAEKAVLALRRVQRKLDKHADENGRPETFGDFIVALAKAIGATNVYVRDPSCRAFYENLPTSVPAKVVTVINWEASRLVLRVNPKADLGSPYLTTIAPASSVGA